MSASVIAIEGVDGGAADIDAPDAEEDEDDSVRSPAFASINLTFGRARIASNHVLFS
jgi:hypothetical protein